MKTTPSPARWLISWRRAVAWHRRKLAVMAVAAAVLCSLGALMPPAPPTVDVVRVTRAVPGGSVLSAELLSVVRAPPDLVPRGAYDDPADVTGRIAAGRLSEGQMITSGALLDSKARLPDGRVLAPLRLADAQVVGLLREGMLVDVLAADARTASAETVARQARIAAVPPPDTDSVRTPDGALVLVEVSPAVAQALARASVVSELSVVWR